MQQKAKPRVLVTRAAGQASALADRLRELGLEPVVVPAIEIVEPTSFAFLDNALGELATFAWVVFASSNAVGVFAKRLGSVGLPGGVKVAAIGSATKRAAEHVGLWVDLVPKVAVAESLADALLTEVRAGEKVLLVRAEQGREVLVERLRAAGVEVVVAPAYRNAVPAFADARLREAVAEGWPDAVTFTSSSTVTHLFALLEAAGLTMPQDVLRVSIGPVTSGTLAEMGYPAQIEAREATVESLAAAVAEALGSLS